MVYFIAGAFGVLALCCVSFIVSADSELHANQQRNIPPKRCTQAEKRASRTLGTFGFCRHTKPTLKNQKSLILANARLK